LSKIQRNGSDSGGYEWLQHGEDEDEDEEQAGHEQQDEDEEDDDEHDEHPQDEDEEDEQPERVQHPLTGFHQPLPMAIEMRITTTIISASANAAHIHLCCK
jgi:hypothetical protein